MVGSRNLGEWHVADQQKEKIGFIGLGIMGRPMSKNLIKAGYDLVVYDLFDSAVDEVMSVGAQGAKSPREVAERTDVVITMVQNSPQVKQAILGANGVAEGARAGQLVIDMSSIDPAVSREVGADLAKKNVPFLDAPVSGGEPKAIDGTLAIMVGGSEQDFARAKPILDIMGASVVLCGDHGAGNVTKLANQICVALNIAALSEALVLAAKSGVDPETVFKAIRVGLAGSTVMDAKSPMILEGNFKPGFRVELHIKDLANALQAGHDVSVPLPLTAVAMEIMQALKADGNEKLDHSAMVLFYEKLANIQARKGIQTASK
ncbi:MAG: 2-hydroxy-3-oxopropionate reductase [Chloroflexi bacterium]|nr:2-hydroxy-3-oxopropionate reductase [Chloroflexota bacterium]